MSGIEGFRQAMQDAGLHPPDHIEPGKLHRFPAPGKNGSNRAAWCKLFDDQRGGVFGDWSTGLSTDYHDSRITSLTDDERQSYRRQVETAQREFRQNRQEEAERAAQQAQSRWDRSTTLIREHAYLEKKKLPPGELRQDGDFLLVPLRNGEGVIAALETIAPAGEKKVWPKGAMVAGTFHLVGDKSSPGPIIITEGWATAAAIHASTEYAVFVARAANNLLPVARSVKNMMPGREIIIAADDDHRDGETANPGIDAARKAAKEVGAKVALPGLGMKADFWDVWSVKGAETVKLAIDEPTAAADFAGAEPADNEGEDFTPHPWPELHPKALYGFAGRFVMAATENSEADQAAVLATFLTRFGVEVNGPVQVSRYAAVRCNNTRLHDSLRSYHS